MNTDSTSGLVDLILPKIMKNTRLIRDEKVNAYTIDKKGFFF
jgi:hypothetical protein